MTRQAALRADQAERVIHQDAGSGVGTLPDPVLQRIEKRDRPDEMQGEPAQQARSVSASRTRAKSSISR